MVVKCTALHSTDTDTERSEQASIWLSDVGAAALPQWEYHETSTFKRAAPFTVNAPLPRPSAPTSHITAGSSMQQQAGLSA